jgi:hypothetical protein
LGDNIEKNKMGGTCSTYRERSDVYTVFFGGNLKERYHLENLDLDGRIILIWIFRKWKGRHGVDSSDLE